MIDTRKLFKVLVLGGMLAIQAGTSGCGGSSEGQGAQNGAVGDGGAGAATDGGRQSVTDGGQLAVADAGTVRVCPWGGDPCPC